MKTSVIGCEYFNDYQVLKWHLDEWKTTKITICGENKVEELAERYARENNIPLENRWPEQREGWFVIWKEYFRIINSCEALMAFWFGESITVSRMINKAKRMGKKVVVVRGFHPDRSIFEQKGTN